MLRTLEKYEILEEIGHGGMATVFRARDTKLDRLVALKVMHPHLRASKEARARFRREAQGVARLRHPRVLEIYDYSGEESEESFIATELLTGPTLKKFADEHPSIPAEIAACFGIEMCRALEAAHDKGIVHRDVKPENILVHENRCVKLTDFGIADMVDSQTMTATGQILGSPGHMAPEQIEGRDADARTDVFALGTVLYFLACGKLPFTGRNPHQILKRIVDGEFADPSRIQPAIGGRFRAIVLRALAHAPADRHATARDLERELVAFVAEIDIDDPEELLARYLADPDAVASEVKNRAIAAGISLGKKANQAGDTASALDYFGRVLALDNGNAQVLALVDKIGRRVRNRSRLTYVGAALGLFGIAAIVSAALVSNGSATGHDGATDLMFAAAGDAGVARVDAPIAVAVVDEPDASTEVRTEVLTKLSAGDPRHEGRLVTEGGAARRVRFSIDPANVRIRVDDQPARDWGPSFRDVELSPGRHRFVIHANVPCCRDAEFEEFIPSGEGDYVLARRLESEPAGLIVRSNVAAAVSIAGLERRANSAILVPIENPERRETFEFTVSAPGHRPFSGRVLLQAGVTHEETITLEPESAGGSANPEREPPTE